MGEIESMPATFECSDADLTRSWPTARNHAIGDILGITEGEPGFTLVRFAPHPGNLQWAKGSLTIAQGIVAVEWRRVAGGYTVDVTVPVGVHVRPLLPARSSDRLLMDGELVAEDSIIRRDDHEVELCVLPGAAYRFDVVAG